VRLSEAGDIILDAVIKRDTEREVLNYVQFSADALVTALRKDVETAVRESRMSYEESGKLLRFYEEGLQGYTYLES
jgi:arginine decarboxylase